MKNCCKAIMLILLVMFALRVYGSIDLDALNAMLFIEKINDRAKLLEIAKNDENKLMRVYAAARLNNQALLLSIVNTEYIASNEEEDDEEYGIRHLAIRYLSDQRIIADIATNNPDWRLRSAAVFRLDDTALLAKLAENDEEDFIRTDARNRLKIISSGNAAMYRRLPSAFVLDAEPENHSEAENDAETAPNGLSTTANVYWMAIPVVCLLVAATLVYFRTKSKRRK